jgi:DNA-binding transcriptional MerR regulator
MSALRIGALAKQAGVSPDTLRYYERFGILPAPSRSSNGYREYGSQALARVQLVQRALACGFTLAELAQVLTRRDRGEAPCRRVRALAEVKLARMEREARLLHERCEALRRTLRGWDRRLARTPRDRQARLLDHLAAAPARDGATGRPRLDFSAS